MCVYIYTYRYLTPFLSFLRDYAAAVQMDPDDKQLKHDLDAIRAARDAQK